ncbi:MAG TPA: HNH endonuclease [Bacteroidia bacterium]|nr:HNH endonuclease [Bacteroidia bacterium]
MLPSPFIPGQRYQRSSIHDQFGGNRQGGIAPCANFPYIFIFTKAGGAKHGYKDYWDNDKVFSYTGEGQSGDMRFVKGNLALRDHLQAGKRVFLFKYVASGFVEFESELEGFDYDYFETPDTAGDMRLGIRFFFKRKGVQLPKQAEKYTGLQKFHDVADLRKSVEPTLTERRGLVTSRVGQGAYRKRIIHRWEYECAVTGFTNPDILIASHIKPWKDSDHDERLDVNNGILLSPVYDALFDRHFISFENTGQIILSDEIETAAYLKIGVTGKERIKKFHEDNYYFLHHHRDVMQGKGV